MGAAPLAAIPRARALRHAAVFHGCDDELHERSATLLAEHVRAGDVVVVVATPTHRAGIRRTARGCRARRRAGGDTSRWLEPTRPSCSPRSPGSDGYDVDRLGELLAGPGRRRHGSTVGGWSCSARWRGLLWTQGLAPPALDFDAVGNRLLDEHDTLELICAYPTGAFTNAPAGPGVAEVCDAHTHRVGAVPRPAPDRTDSTATADSILPTSSARRTPGR